MTRGIVAFLTLAATAVAWGVAVFHDPGYVQFGDWDQYVTFFEIQRISWMDHGELPHWNPWLLGGIPGHAHPQFNSLSPYLLPVLLFGAVKGAAWYFTLHAWTGLAGMYLLARFVGFRRPAAYLAGLVFLFACAPFVVGGVVNRVNGSVTPWLILALLAAHRDPRHIVSFAVVTALAILEGAFYALAGTGVLLGILVLASGGWAQWWRTATTLATGFVAGVGLSAIRLWPTLELYAQYPRESGLYAGSSVWNLEALPRLAAALGALLSAPAVGQRKLLFDQPIFVGVDLGLPLLTLLVLAVYLCARRWLPWLLTLLFLALVLGNASPINLFAVTQSIPGLKSFNLPMSFLFCAFVPLALLAASAAQEWARRLTTRTELVVAAVAVGAALVPLLWQSSTLLDRHVRPELPAAQAASGLVVQTRGARPAMLPSIRRGEGVISAYEEVISSRLTPGAVPRDSAAYPGEWWWEGEGQVEFVAATPQRLSFRANGHSGRLHLNHNHAAGWRAAEPLHLVAAPGPEGVGPHLAVDVPAGAERIELHYDSPAFTRGAWVSACFALALGSLLTPWGRRKLRVLTTSSPLPARLGPIDPDR